MPQFDLTLAELETYRSTIAPPADLDEFWSRSIARAREVAAPAVRHRHEATVYRRVEVDDVTFSGADGHPIRAWFLRPAGGARVPCVVQYIGYGDGRGTPSQHMLYPALGIAALVMDTRGQGGWYGYGATGDPGAGEGGPEHPGVLTRGIASPATYYYRRLFTDAVRAVDVAAEMPGVDADRLTVSGASQGGALALAAAALAPSAVSVCHADIPFMCDIAHAAQISNRRPYTEIAEYLEWHVDAVDAVHATLTYFDLTVLVPRITAACFVSVGLMDEICPPSTVFAAYNAIEVEKRLAVHHYGRHVVPELHRERQVADLVARLEP